MPALTAPSAMAAHLIGSLVLVVDVVVASGFRTLLHGTASLGDYYGVEAMAEDHGRHGGYVAARERLRIMRAPSCRERRLPS
jgi:hypothetical protein